MAKARHPFVLILLPLVLPRPVAVLLATAACAVLMIRELLQLGSSLGKPPALGARGPEAYPASLERSAHELWLVDGEHFDLVPLMASHPGGERILRLTRGQDVSTLFRVHHLREEPRARLRRDFLVARVSGTPIEPSAYSYSFAADGFYATVRARVTEHLRRTGALASARQAGGAYLAKAALSLSAFALSWGWLALAPPLSACWLAACVANVVARMVLTGVGHEADHGVVLPRRPAAQRALARLCIEGLLSYELDAWYALHMRHHVDTKTDGDPDENRGPRARNLWRLSSQTPWRPSHGRPRAAQLAAGAALNAAKTAERPEGGGRARAACSLLALHLLPLYAQPQGAWAGLLTVAFTSWAASYVTLLAFHANHIQHETEREAYRAGVDWGAHQLATTANFDAGTYGLSGGLDVQVEHHLFPMLSYDQQRAVRPLVRAAAREHGLAYYEYPSLRHALLAHLRFMDVLGRPPPGGSGARAGLGHAGHAS